MEQTLLEIRNQQLAALNRAAIAIAGDLALDRVLQQIVDSARELASAQNAALGIPDAEGFLETFIYSGMPPETAAGIPHLPRGLGLLGAIMREKRPIRVPRIGDDPRSVGFPANHPPMESFLGVPIVAGDAVLGNLYLTEKIGAAEFTEADEELITGFAAHAAIAITNARLFQDSVKRGQELALRNQELAMLNVVARAASQHLELGEMLAEVLEQVMRLTDMESGEIFLLDEPTGDMVQTLYQGPAADAFRSITRFRSGEGFPGQVAETGVAIDTTGWLPEESPGVSYRRQAVVDAGFNSHVYAPLRVRNRIVGVMGLASSSRQTFDERRLELLEAIGNQIGLGVENARLYHRVGELAVIEERSRIGMDLHDGVIQSIYAAGLTLESARLALPDGAEEANRFMGHVVETLNEAIRDIRNFILDLRPHRFEGDLNEGLVRLVREFQANTMVAVELDVSPEAIARLPAALARAIFMTTQEALANIARHAGATQVKISLQPVDSAILLTVVDNGRGFDTGKRTHTGHGLANMRSRAEEGHGTFTIHSAPGQGTSLQMRLPLKIQ